MKKSHRNSNDSENNLNTQAKGLYWDNKCTFLRKEAGTSAFGAEERT